MAGDGGNSHHRSLRHQQPPIKRSRLTLHCPLPKIKSFQNTVGKCWEPSGQVWMNQSMATLETLWKPQTTSCQQKSTTARSHCDAFLVSLLSVWTACNPTCLARRGWNWSTCCCAICLGFDRWFIPLFIGFQPSKVMQDFFHPQYICTYILYI